MSKHVPLFKNMRCCIFSCALLFVFDFKVFKCTEASGIASHMGRKCKQKCITASVKFVATLKSSCLCSEHFTADMFYQKGKYSS